VDRIAIENIRAFGRHGWSEDERKQPQRLTIDIELKLDLQRAGTSDDLGDTVDYAELQRRIVERVETTSYALLERLATVLLDDIFADRRIAHASVRIAKPEILEGATPSVTVRRDNSQAGCR
jgi:dihydroneopterin aldolase